MADEKDLEHIRRAKHTWESQTVQEVPRTASLSAGQGFTTTSCILSNGSIPRSMWPAWITYQP